VKGSPERNSFKGGSTPKTKEDPRESSKLKNKETRAQRQAARITTWGELVKTIHEQVGTRRRALGQMKIDDEATRAMLLRKRKDPWGSSSREVWEKWAEDWGKRGMQYVLK